MQCLGLDLGLGLRVARAGLKVRGLGRATQTGKKLQG